MNNRRTGKVARLPKASRDVVNLMIQDGATYQQIIEKLGDLGRDITIDNLSQWKNGGFQDWLAEQERLEDMKAKREFAMDIVRQNEGSQIHEASLQLAASQIYEVLSEYDIANLKGLLVDSPKNFANLVNALAKLSKGALEIQKYKDAMAKAKTELAKLRDPKTEMSETERNAILDKVDEVLGLK